MHRPPEGIATAIVTRDNCYEWPPKEPTAFTAPPLRLAGALGEILLVPRISLPDPQKRVDSALELASWAQGPWEGVPGGPEGVPRGSPGEGSQRGVSEGVSEGRSWGILGDPWGSLRQASDRGFLGSHRGSKKTPLEARNSLDPGRDRRTYTPYPRPHTGELQMVQRRRRDGGI